MQFIVYCTDRATGDLRAKTRAKHLRYLVDTISQPHPYVYAGPLIGPEGKTVGSLFVMSATGRAELDRLLARDPYFRDGIFASIQIHPTRQMLPETNPGSLAQELQNQLERDRQA